MYKTFYLFLLSLALFKTAKSQHCDWDNCYVIILDVRDSMTNKIINDLDIMLTDSSGKPYRSKWNLDNFKETSIYQNTDTLKFGQNKGNNYPKHGSYNIPFGVNNYMLLVYANNYPDFNENGSDKILIKDKKGLYDDLSLTFDKTKIAHMCTSSPIRHNKNKLDAVTIKIKIRKKQA
jgi:hypothetical protein